MLEINANNVRNHYKASSCPSIQPIQQTGVNVSQKQRSILEFELKPYLLAFHIASQRTAASL